MNRMQADKTWARARGKLGPFYYFKGRYALLQLARLCGSGLRVADIRRSPHAKLLEKPVVKDLLGRTGDGELTSRACRDFIPVAPEVYNLTLGVWGRNDGLYGLRQTSRNGENLVIQVNFPRIHDAAFRVLQKLEGTTGFNYPEYHPVATPPDVTMAWARVDVEDGEALIEEIQSDWFSAAFWEQRWAESEARVESCWDGRDRLEQKAGVRRWQRYIRFLLPHARMWQEVTLSATLEVLYGALGVRRVFYHTFEGGSLLKGIKGLQPPRSLYTKLPRQFGFRKTGESPRLLEPLRSQRRWRRNPERWPSFQVLVV